MEWLKKYWWTIVAGVALVAGFIFGGMFKKKEEGDPPSFADMAFEEAARIQEQIDAEKAKAKAETEEQLARLAEIEKMKNVVERRKRLAEFLEGL